MGWDYTHAKHYKNNGRIDIKAECRELINNERFTIHKDTLVGNTYYAAVSNNKTPNNIFAAVILTRTSMVEYYNFGAKILDETMGPVEAKCSKGILDLLSFTDNKYALEWREKCRNNLDKKSDINSLGIGARIKAELNGQEYILIKRSPAYQFKTPWWEVEGESTYFKKNLIQKCKVTIL